MEETDFEQKTDVERRASRLADWCAENKVGDCIEVSSEWMERRNGGEVSFEKSITDDDLLFRNRLVAWSDPPADLGGPYKKDRNENLGGQVDQAHATACRYETEDKRTLVVMNLRDETFSPSRSVEFIEAFQGEIGAESYNFETSTYDRFAFYEVACDCGDNINT